MRKYFIFLIAIFPIYISADVFQSDDGKYYECTIYKGVRCSPGYTGFIWPYFYVHIGGDEPPGCTYGTADQYDGCQQVSGCPSGTFYNPTSHKCEVPCDPIPGKTPNSLTESQCSGQFYFDTGYVTNLEWHDCDSKCYGNFVYCPRDQYMDPNTLKCIDPSPPECQNQYSKSLMLVDPQTGHCINKISFYCDDVLYSEYTLSCGTDPTDSNSYTIIDLELDGDSSASGSITETSDSQTTTTVQKPDGSTVTTTTTTTQNPDGSTTTNINITTTYPDGTTSTETQTTTSSGDGKNEISIDLKPVTDRLDIISDKMDVMIEILSDTGDSNNSNHDEYGICKTCYLGWHSTSDGKCQSDTWPFHTMECPYSDTNGSGSGDGTGDGTDTGADDQNSTSDAVFDSTSIDQLANDIETSNSDLISFVEGLKNRFENVSSDINNTIALFQNKPVFNMGTTQSCSYTSSLMGRNYTIDLCKYVAPYQSTITIVFTVIGAFFVLIFATKYLISRGD